MNRHARRAAAHRGEKVKSPAMRAFEQELAANIRTLRPELTFLELLRAPDLAIAIVRIHDKTRSPSVTPVRLVAPVGIASGPYTELVLAAFDAATRLDLDGDVS